MAMQIQTKKQVQTIQTVQILLLNLIAVWFSSTFHIIYIHSYMTLQMLNNVMERIAYYCITNVKPCAGS